MSNGTEDSLVPAEHKTVVSAPVASVSLDRREWSRKLWHMSAGLLSFIVPLVPFIKPEVTLYSDSLMRAIIITTTVVWMLWSLSFFRKFIRPGESRYDAKVAGYILSVIGPLIAFPQHLQFGLTVLAILAIGDGAAGLIGMVVQGRKLPWNPEKTFAGSLGFVLCSAPAAALVFWISSSHSPTPVPWVPALLIGCLASLTGAIAESWASKINDNLRVGIVAGLTLMLGHWFLIGPW